MCPTLSRRARSSGGVFDAAAHSDVGAAGIDGASLARSLDFFVLGSVSGDAESFSPIGDARFIGDSTTCVPPTKLGLDVLQRLRSSDRFVVVVEIFERLRPARAVVLAVRRLGASSSALAPRVDLLVRVAAALAARELTERVARAPSHDCFARDPPADAR